MKTILFDIDDTLLSCPKGANTKGSEKMFREVFALNAHEEMIAHIGKTERGIIEDVIRSIKGLKPDQEVEIPNKAYQVWTEGTGEILQHYPPLVLPGMENLLQELFGKQGIKIGLLTGNSRFRAEVKLKTAGLDHFFQTDNGVLKGAFGDVSSIRADLLSEAKDKYGEGAYIVIDDSIVAGKMIKENNIPGILVATGTASVEELRQYSNYVFEDFGATRWQQAIKIIQDIKG